MTKKIIPLSPAEESFLKFADDIEKCERGEKDSFILDCEEYSTYPTKELLKKAIAEPEYKLIFRYESGPSYIEPTSRKYIFELYLYHLEIEQNKTINKMIYKEWKPSAWEGEMGIERLKNFDPAQYQKALNWRKEAKVRLVKDDEKVLALIKEFPNHKSLREVEVYDYSMSELNIDIEGFKAEYNWMMLVDECKDFEERIKKIVESCKL